ncbi:hypothetical protein ABZ832_06870 [Streptantibioticus parmotrematis]|uniref:hypothetical protein n=1 Tax=Streptantibioticus parmotrematis TaxID=2873249 RepID=UPI0033DA1117
MASLTHGLGRMAVLAAAGLTLATGLTAATTHPAHADSLGERLALPDPGVVFDRDAPHSWASTTVHLDWQADANLVLYCNSNTAHPNKVLWASGTDQGSTFTDMQIDFGDGGSSGVAAGGITIFEYETGPVLYGWYPVWGPSSTAPGDYAYVQNDGNFVIYPKGGGKALWATNTNGKC